jgi:hypothetical protein
MIRLLELLRRQGPNAEVFAALVQACRFSGLLDASAAAHDQAVRLDAAIETGVMHTYFLQGSWEEAIVASGLRKGYVWGLSMAEVGRTKDAVPVLAQQTGIFAAVHAYLIGDHALAAKVLRDVAPADPEALFYAARLLARVGEPDLALEKLAGAINGGYACVGALAGDSWLDAIRPSPAFKEIEHAAEMKYDAACRLFSEAGGEALLGMR